MFTLIKGTVTETGDCLINKHKIESIFKQSQLTKKPQTQTLIGQQSEPEYEEVYFIIINGVGIVFYDKEKRDEAFELLIK
jgi:hypothetical protein